MFVTLPTGAVINKHQIVKMDVNSAGDTRLVMTGGIVVTLRSTSLAQVLELLDEH